MPVSSIIMACEMCASYTLLVPLMLVSTISYLLLGKVSLYEKQVVDQAGLAGPYDRIHPGIAGADAGL